MLAALGHTAYKLSLFMLPNADIHANLMFLGVGTFVIGILFGLGRRFGGGIIVPIAGHVVFDIIAYGDWTQAPWWI